MSCRTAALADRGCAGDWNLNAEKLLPCIFSKCGRTSANVGKADTDPVNESGSMASGIGVDVEGLS
jgi:hypothetical protein